MNATTRCFFFLILIAYCGAPATVRAQAASADFRAGIAMASGFADAETVRDLARIAAVRERMVALAGPYLAVVKIKAERSPVVMPPKSGVILKSRFRQALLSQY